MGTAEFVTHVATSLVCYIVMQFWLPLLLQRIAGRYCVPHTCVATLLEIWNKNL